MNIEVLIFFAIFFLVSIFETEFVTSWSTRNLPKKKKNLRLPFFNFQIQVTYLRLRSTTVVCCTVFVAFKLIEYEHV